MTLIHKALKAYGFKEEYNESNLINCYVELLKSGEVGIWTEKEINELIECVDDDKVNKFCTVILKCSPENKKLDSMYGCESYDEVETHLEGLIMYLAYIKKEQYYSIQSTLLKDCDKYKNKFRIYPVESQLITVLLLRKKEKFLSREHSYKQAKLTENHRLQMESEYTQGIYAIRNIPNGRTYVGKASNIASRWYDHKSLLRNNKHHTKDLQNDWNEYEEGDFEFYRLERIKEKWLMPERESYWKNHFDKINGTYNSANPMGIMTKLQIQVKRLENELSELRNKIH